MGLFLSNRDGGKTDELGHNYVVKHAFAGNVLSGLTTSQSGTPALTVDVAEGIALIDDGDKKYEVWSDATETLAITTPNVSNPRIDLVVGYIDLDETVQNTTPNNEDIFKLAVVAGTPAGSPSVPSAGQIQSAIGASNPYTILSQIAVGAGVTTITNGSITDRRTILTNNLSDANTSGWIDNVLASPSSITNNGNRSFDLVFSGEDYTQELSEGTRLKLVRSVTAPAQSTSLNGSSQYWSKSSPNKMSFTDDFSCGRWVKLDSYGNVTMDSRFNGSSGWAFAIDSNGRVTLIGYNASAANFSEIKSLQSIPLNKWVFVSAQLDMSAYSASTTNSYVMIDGLDVPAVVARGGSNPTALVQAGDYQVGALNGTNFFDGQLGSGAVFSAKVTQSNWRLYMTQGFSGSETNLATANSFDGVATDLNTTTPNNLTAVSSAGYVADSPFGGGSRGYDTAGTTEYAVVVRKPVFSTNTTVTVQVPEGHTIPTSGGIASVSYSREAKPYGFPANKARWVIESLLRVLANQGTPTDNVYYNLGSHRLNIPAGDWRIGFNAPLGADRGVAGGLKANGGLSTSTSSLSSRELSFSTEGSSIAILYSNMVAYEDVSLLASTIYYLIARVQGAGHNNVYNLGDRSKSVIEAIPNFL